MITSTRAKRPPKNPDASVVRRISVNAPPAPTNEANGPAPKAAAAAPAKSADELLAQMTYRIRTVSVEDLVRHPLNRRPSAESIVKIAESLATDGQLEALVVRQAAHDLDLFEIISGETRQLAAKKIGKKQLQVRELLECSDERAMELVVLYNAKRTDLTPIEKAEKIEQLSRPVDKGGFGKTLEQAARLVGLESGAAASNLLRLLKLPKVWRDRVNAEELPQRFARLLTPYAHAPRIMEALDAEWKDDHKPNGGDYKLESWATEGNFESTVERIVEDCARPIDGKATHNYGYSVFKGDYQYQGNYPRLFELTDEVRKTLDVVTMPIDGKEIEVATNTKAYDKLQIPLIKKSVDAKQKSKASKSADDDERASTPKKKLTPAQQKAADKIKDEQLEARIRGWRHAWLKTLVAMHMADVDASPVLEKFVTALVLTNGGSIGRELADAFAEALPKGIGFRYGDLGDGWATAKKIEAAGGDHYEVLTKAICEVLAEEDRDPRHPKIPFELIDGMAAELKIDLAKAWEFDLNDEGTRFEPFLLLHTGAQLDALNEAEKWGIYITGKGKTDKISIIKASSQMLPLPKCVAPVAAVGGTAKKKRGKR